MKTIKSIFAFCGYNLMLLATIAMMTISALGEFGVVPDTFSLNVVALWLLTVAWFACLHIIVDDFRQWSRYRLNKFLSEDDRND